ncbi:MAG TPA: biopolymer transporter ExbD [Betaproteobacteria bacterium]|nr:biopolymer transporter ExbD [Betaproteobacteria bacterium]
MDFQRGKRRDEPEINLIPMIDVLLVILIFLMTTTTFSKFRELQINLPQAQSKKQSEKNNVIDVTVDAQGHYRVNHTAVAYQRLADLTRALRKSGAQMAHPVVVIAADAKATHQSVINIMEAARQAGYVHITFAVQEKQGS